jgi:hypothetical protein
MTRHKTPHPVPPWNCQRLLCSIWHVQHVAVLSSRCWAHRSACYVFLANFELVQIFSTQEKFSAERKFCKRWLADTNFPSEKNFEVENFQLLTIFLENFLSVEIFLEWKWVLFSFEQHKNWENPHANSSLSTIIHIWSRLCFAE